MKKLFRNIAFNLGFWGGVAMFVLVNLVIYSVDTKNFYSTPMTFSAAGYNTGFPFAMYQVNVGYLNRSYFLWNGLIANFLIALIFSFAVGLVFKFIWSKSSSHNLK